MFHLHTNKLTRQSSFVRLASTLPNERSSTRQVLEAADHIKTRLSTVPAFNPFKGDASSSGQHGPDTHQKAGTRSRAMVASPSFETDRFEFGGAYPKKHAREAGLALHSVCILTEKQLDLKIDPWCEENMAAYPELPTPKLSTPKTNTPANACSVKPSRQTQAHQLCVSLFFSNCLNHEKNT